MPSGPPKRRKKRSIGEPGWNGESSLFALSSLASFSLMLIFTEITDGLTRSTMSAKPTGRSTLRTSLLTCACAGLLKRSTGPGDGLRPSTRTCARKTANGGVLDRTGGTKDLSDGRSSRKSPKREIDGAGGEHLMDLKMGISPLPRAGGGIKLL